MKVDGMQANAPNPASLRELLRSNVFQPENNAVSRDTRIKAFQVLGGGRPLLLEEPMSVPMPERALFFAPRSGLENIKLAAAEILRQAQAIPQEYHNANQMLLAEKEQQPAPPSSLNVNI